MKTKIYFLLFFQCFLSLVLTAQYDYNAIGEEIPCNCQDHQSATPQQVTCYDIYQNTKTFTCINGKKQGEVIYKSPRVNKQDIFHSQLTVERVGRAFYKDDLLEGEEIYYHVFVITTSGDIHTASPHMVYCYTTDAIKIKSFYKAGKKEGEEIEYCESGGIRRKTFYKDGLIEGEEIVYHEIISQPNEMKSLLDIQNIKKTCPATDIYRKTLYKAGKKHGEEIYYHITGAIKSTVLFQNGKEEGYYIQYNMGDILSKVFYKAGKKEGEEITYSFYTELKNKSFYKELKSKYFYKDGNFHGEQIHYYQSGIIREKVFYKDGQKHGDDITYDQSGAIERKCSYKDGKRNGEYITYYESGAIQSKSLYKNDKQIGNTISYKEAQNIRE